MANTQNLDLVKPLGTDYALVSVLNSNSDKIDAYAGAVNASLDGLRDGLGILANGNTHAAVTSGQFVYVKNHQTLPQGLYQATTNIAANGTLSTSNLTADPKGGLNTLNEQIGNKLVYKKVHVLPSDTTNSIYDSGVSTSSYYCIGGMLPNDDDIEVRVCAKNGTWQYTLWSISSGGKIGNNYNYWVHLSFLSRTNLTEIT